MDHIHTLAVVDDDEVVRFLTSIIADRSRAVDQIKLFFNGKEAIDYLHNNAENPDALPDVILLDLEMPLMNGHEFLEEFKKLKPFIGKKIIIFIVSSLISEGVIEKLKSTPEVSDYIIKPISPEKFAHILEIYKKSQSIL